MSLYTLVIDFDGGTYIAQGEADSVIDAPKRCVLNWDIRDLKHVLTEQDRSVLLALLNEEEFVPLNGVKNVWCGCVNLHQHLLTLNLVRTDNAV